ncbi:MAG: ATP-dependent RecD-like DNA helicase [Alphaproteobacteria bacterium]|nr:ATP-dependent RecD-like DNA helicase [Alphaproteobacteria bacterium]
MEGESNVSPLVPCDRLSGLIERVTFHNEETGFCVLQVRVAGGRHLVTVVGHNFSVSIGECIEATEGFWVHDPVHGRQFRAHSLKVLLPGTEESIEKYLASGMIRGIGPVYAKKLVSAFGCSVFDIIDTEPERLSSIPGLGSKKIALILKAWEEQKSVRSIMLFLHEHGVGTHRAFRIFKIYGHATIGMISENPYRLAYEVRSIGFLTADSIAMKLGFGKESPFRLRAGILYTLRKALDDGHCGLPRDLLLTSASKHLDVLESLIIDALDLELKVKGSVLVCTFVEERECLFLSSLYHAEVSISERLLHLKQGALPWSQCDPGKGIIQAEHSLGFNFSERQKAAVRCVLSSKLSVITGGPGVGKTTIISAVLKILESSGLSVLLCAPTGRAARRLNETTGRDAKTIHRLLEFDPYKGAFRYDAESRLDCDFLLVDETSMVDVFLMNALLMAVPDHAAVILLGDVDQLPSVGPGQVLSDIIGSGAVDIVRLTEVFRQASGSDIVSSAHCINVGSLPEFSSGPGRGNFYFIQAGTPEVALSHLLEVVCNRIPARFQFDPVRDIQVLSPMNVGGLGVHALNVALQKVLNADSLSRIERFGTIFSVGDKVMQMENDYEKEVYNGDIGFIAAINSDPGSVLIDFGSRHISYTSDELDEISLAYAITIHKSQGSEYPVVVMPVTLQHYPMLQRKLLYTGVTRAKELLVLIGQKSALSIAVKNVTNQNRYSKLKELLNCRES